MPIHAKASQMPVECGNDLLDEEAVAEYIALYGEEDRYEHDYADPELMEAHDYKFGEVWICRKCGHGYKANQEPNEPVELPFLTKPN